MTTLEIREERRKYPRTDAFLMFTYVSKDNGQQKMGRTLDISRAGCEVEIFEPILLDSCMKMKLQLDSKDLNLQGRVVHARETPEGKHLIGIEFDTCQDVLDVEI